MTKVISTIIKARLMNNGPTVPRTNRLKASTGTSTGAALKAQNKIGCVNGEKNHGFGETGDPVTACAIGRSRPTSAFSSGSASANSAREMDGAPASCNSAPSAGRATTYARRIKKPRIRRSGPQNKAKRDEREEGPRPEAPCIPGDCCRSRLERRWRECGQQRD